MEIDLCMKAVTELYLLENDTLFDSNQRSKGMYILATGKFVKCWPKLDETFEAFILGHTENGSSLQQLRVGWGRSTGHDCEPPCGRLPFRARALDQGMEALWSPRNLVRAKSGAALEQTGVACCVARTLRRIGHSRGLLAILRGHHERHASNV
eukprot:s2914_g6.t1